MSRTASPAGSHSLLARVAELPPEHLAVLLGGALALAVAAAGALQGPGAAILILAAAALLVAISALWASLRSLAGDRPMSADEAYGLATPRAEDDQKRTVLRALKDLEFERRVGKISEQDFGVLQTRYRQQAAELLAEQSQVDQAMLERAERLIRARLAEAARAPDSSDPDYEDDDELDDELDDDYGPDSDEEPAAVCSACHTRNDADAAFCKRCGRALEDEPQSEPEP